MRSRRQRLGQHFLRDSRVARAIAAALPAEPPRVIEVGPGRGALTAPLLERFGRVRALELDRDLAATLASRLGRPAGLEVVPGDALTIDLEALAEGGPWLLAGNLPFSVGTAIIRRLLPRHDLLACLVVMVQLEVAERLLARPGEAARGLLSLEVEAHARVALLLTVPPRCFSPPPKVVSAVVKLELAPPPAPPGAVARALALAAAAFTHRRKMLANSLAGQAPPDVLDHALVAAGVERRERPQDLPLGDWLALARELPAPVGQDRAQMTE